jgi:ribonuclease J
MKMDPNHLFFLPLGGTGEIGMNFNLYHHQGKWLAVDCGLGFASTDTPEVEMMVPDPSFIADRRDDLVGLVITHAHEDHIGAVAWLWRRLRCPVYATPFAAAVLRRKLTEAQLLHEVKLHVIPPGGQFDLAPFQLQFIRVAHSVPEAQALVIRTPAGVLLHTGDWKLDPDPLLGPPTDEAALSALGDEGVLAMICDSTNAMVEGRSGSEASVRASLTDLISQLRGRIAVTCFASNVTRVESVAVAAHNAGRQVVLVGRSLRNAVAAAKECGYLRDAPVFGSEDDAADIPDDKLVLIVTGSQGEPRSALARIATDSHPRIALGEGDIVLFSSRVIPGNERAIHAVQDNLVRRGVRLVTEDDHPIHVSGHPARDELRHLYKLIRPRISVPVHGEWRHLQAHAALARDMGCTPVLLEDGDVLRLSPGQPEIVDSAYVGRLALDGPRLVPLNSDVMAARRRMLYNGVVIGSIAIDQAGVLRGMPRISAPGLFAADDPEFERVLEEFRLQLDDIATDLRLEETLFAEAARAALRRALGRRLQKRPMVDVHLLRV